MTSPRSTATGRTGWWLLLASAGGGAAVAIVAGVLAISGAFGRGERAGSQNDLPTATAGQLGAGGHSLGAVDAPVTVLEFADFQCPYCRAFWAGSLEQLKREFVDTGRARLVFRHTIILGAESLLAAEAAECAADQGQFFAYHDALFEGQGPERSGYLTTARLTGFATQIGLDVAAFDRCLVTGARRSDVSQVSNESREAGVNSTPSVFVNGRRVANPFDWAALRSAILSGGGGD